MKAPLLVALLAAMAEVSPPDPRRRFLFDHGWVPLGADCTTGIEGWGKVIDGRAVTIPIDEALALESY